MHTNTTFLIEAEDDVVSLQFRGRTGRVIGERRVEDPRIVNQIASTLESFLTLEESGSGGFSSSVEINSGNYPVIQISWRHYEYSKPNRLSIKVYGKRGARIGQVRAINVPLRDLVSQMRAVKERAFSTLLDEGQTASERLLS